MINDYIYELNFKFDIHKLKQSLEWILDDADINRVESLCLTHAPAKSKHPDDYYYQGAGSLYYEFKTAPGKLIKTKREDPLKESDFTHFIDKLKHTYFFEVYQQLSTKFDIGRMRVMKLNPLNCLTWHHDTAKRIHIPIITNPGNKLVVEDTVAHLPANGQAYMVDTTRNHSAFNAGLENRYNLLCSLHE
tara:strand:- start:1667 stop:2236 length:570 start_codon:yes stop_codon:yes gene_type:complete